MKKLVQFILCIVILISCQNEQRKVVEISSLSTSSEILKQHTENKKYNSEQPPKLEDSIWVFQTLKENPYPYDTILSNGYYLKHKVFRLKNDNEFIQSLILMKESKVIKEFGGNSFGLPYKNIGYIGADFEESFVLVHSFGSGNPHEIELIEKKTGSILREGTWVDANDKEQILLYIKDEFLETEQLKILDIKNRNEINVNDFNETNCVKQVVGGLRNCVQLDTVTNEKIILFTDYNGEKIVKTYKR